MAGFSINPQVLAQLAAAGFRPQPTPNMPGFNLQPQLPPARQQTPGFNVSDGMAALRAGLDALKGRGGGTIINAGPQGSGPGGAYTPADAMGMAGLNGKQTLSPMDPGYGDLGGPGMAKGGGILDFLTGGSSSAGGAAGSSGGGMGGVGAAAIPAAIAAAIGFGKNTEANHANTPFGDGLLAALGPDINQVVADPIGMGLPTLLGVPFITPFTARKEAKSAKPEWSPFFPVGA